MPGKGEVVNRHSTNKITAVPLLTVSRRSNTAVSRMRGCGRGTHTAEYESQKFTPGRVPIYAPQGVASAVPGRVHTAKYDPRKFTPGCVPIYVPQGVASPVPCQV